MSETEEDMYMRLQDDEYRQEGTIFMYTAYN